MKGKLSLIILFLFCFLSSTVAQEKIVLEEYQVYKDWLEQAIVKPETTQIAVSKFTDIIHGEISRLNEIKSLTRHLQSSARKSYRLNNRKPSELDNHFNLDIDIIFINKEKELNNYLKSVYEKSNKADYLLAFSRVGFSRDKKQALIHVDFIGGKIFVVPEGYFYLLVKKNGRWIIQEKGKSWEH